MSSPLSHLPQYGVDVRNTLMQTTMGPYQSKMRSLESLCDRSSWKVGRSDSVVQVSVKLEPNPSYLCREQLHHCSSIRWQCSSVELLLSLWHSEENRKKTCLGENVETGREIGSEYGLYLRLESSEKPQRKDWRKDVFSQ